MNEALAQPAPVQYPDMWRVRLPRWTNPGIWNPMPKTPNQQADIDDWKSQDGAVIEYAVVISELPSAQPTQRTWVGLTEEEIQAVAKQARSKDHAVTLTNKLLKEKNSGLL